MPLPLPEDLAAELLPAFGSDGLSAGKPLTQHALVQWQLGKYEFKSRGHRLIGSQKLEAPVREALQILEHAELVYLTVESERPEKCTITGRGLQALRGGKDAVRQRISERNGATTPSSAQRLQELEALRSTGAISEAEYTTKRAQIIDEI
jgi:hypothetical protein